jgi:hypothetical protein
LTLRLRTSLWVGVCLGFFLISRAPAMLCPFQLNVDEGQMLAQAMRYGQDLTPWRAVDGETGGPILSWFLLLGHDVGLPFSFRTEHVLAALCLAGTLLATFAAARRLAGEEAARIALAAGSLWLALIPDADFSHYSSELVPDLFIALALLGLVGPARPKAGGGGRIFFVGLLLGLVPWAKLQAVPIALLLGLWAMIGLVRGGTGAAPERRWRDAGRLIAGALLPTALLLLWVVQAGAWGQFWHSYILANLSRAAGKPWGVQGSNLLHLLLFQEGAPWFIGAGLLALGALVLRGRAGWRMAPRGMLLLAALLLAAAVFAILRPVVTYSHYEQLCLVPLLLLVAGCARVLIGDDVAAADPRRNAGWIILAIGLVPLPIAYFCHYDGWRILGETWRYDRSPAFQPQAFVDRAVRHLAPEATSLAVWGWAPYLYVDLGIPPGTRDAGYASMTDGNPSEDFIRAGFLGDLEKSSPQVIVDTEDYIAGGVRKTGPETFPALAAYLRTHYQLIGRGTVTRGPDLSLLVDVYLRHP